MWRYDSIPQPWVDRAKDAGDLVILAFGELLELRIIMIVTPSDITQSGNSSWIVNSSLLHKITKIGLSYLGFFLTSLYCNPPSTLSLVNLSLGSLLSPGYNLLELGRTTIVALNDMIMY